DGRDAGIRGGPGDLRAGKVVAGSEDDGSGEEDGGAERVEGQRIVTGEDDRRGDRREIEFDRGCRALNEHDLPGGGEERRRTAPDLDGDGRGLLLRVHVQGE